MANQSGFKITARDFFQYKTIAAIYEHLDTAQDESADNKRAGAIQAIPRSQRRQRRIRGISEQVYQDLPQ